MRTFSILALGTAALSLFSALPTACGATVAIEKRDSASQALTILTSATSQIVAIDAKIQVALKGGVSVSVAAEIVPLVLQVNTIVATTAHKITALKSSSKSKRQAVNDQAVAAALAALVQQIEITIQPLVSFLEGIPLVENLLGGLLAGLDANLTTIATGLGQLLGGVLEIVRELLSSLLNGLSGLGFLNFLSAIGA